MRRWFTTAFAFAALLGLALPALPQTRPPASEKAEPRPPPAPPLRIEDLFEKLKAAKDAADARNFADQIQRIWGRSGSDTADMLMQRAGKAVESKDTDLALDLIDSILALAPGWAEAWHRRASVHFIRKDLDGAMRDLGVVLTREPRHFKALMELGAILMQVDRKKQALVMMKRAADIHPHNEPLTKMIERLGLEVEGQGV